VKKTGKKNVFVSVSDKQIDPSQITNPDSVAALSSEKKSKSVATNTKAIFVINRDKAQRDKTLKVVSQKQLALQEYTNKLRLNDQLIHANQVSIKKLNHAIDQQLATLQVYQKQLSKAGDDSQNSLSDAIQKVQDIIKQTQSDIANAKQNITKAEADRRDLKQMKAQVQSDKLDLPKATNL
jgi:chromosome segregation ATPase